MVSEIEMTLEEQLAAVQRQLLALSQLPAAIQQTLDVVTSQLAKIVGDGEKHEDTAAQDSQADGQVSKLLDSKKGHHIDDCLTYNIKIFLLKICTIFQFKDVVFKAVIMKNQELI